MRDSENTNETETQRAHFFCRFFLGSGDFDDFEEPDELLLPLLPLPDELPLLLPLLGRLEQQVKCTLMEDQHPSMLLGMCLRLLKLTPLPW